MLWGPKVIKSAPKGSPKPRFRPRKERPMAKEKKRQDKYVQMVRNIQGVIAEVLKARKEIEDEEKKE